MSAYDGFESERVKHLEMIQAVISRLGTDSFLVKGWAVTVSGAFVGFAIDRDSWGLAVAGVVPALLFWILDGYFLHAERLFRALFDAVRTGSPAVQPFFMSATASTFTAAVPQGKRSWAKALFSRTPAIFYGTLIVSALTAAAILCN